MAKRTVGAVTVAAASGSVVGAAAAAVTVWGLGQLGLDATPIEDALGILFAAAGATYGGYLVPARGSGKRVADDGE